MDLLLLLFDKSKFLKTKKTHILQLFCNHLQYANNVDKEYEEKNGVGFARQS
jgi:hypothetical protein